MIVFIALYLSVASQLALAVDMENCWVSSLKRATLSMPRFRVLSHSNGFFLSVSQVLLAMSHSNRIFQFRESIDLGNYPTVCQVHKYVNN